MNKQNQGRYRGAEDVSNSNQRKPFPSKPFICSVCKFATTKSGYLKKHEKRHLPNKDEEAQSSYGTQDQGNFNTIMPNPTNSKTLLCTKCIDSGDSCAMNKHRKNQCPLNKFKCTECKFTTSVEGYLRTHIKNKHDPSRFHCNHCSFNTPDEGNWKLHQLRHLKPLPVSFKCKECGFCTDSKNSLKRHVIKKHATFQCTQCTFSTQDEGEWNMHQMKHLKPLQYKCTECDFCTDEKGSLKNHEIKEHGSQIFRCNHCSFTTRFEPTLTRHNEIHPDKPIKCANCDFIAVCERSLKIHQESQCQPNHFEYKPNSVVQTNDQLFLKYNMIRALSGQFNNFRSFNVETPVKTSLDASAVTRALSAEFPDYQQHPQCATLSTDFDAVQMSQGSSWSIPKTAEHSRFETLTNMEAVRGVTSSSSSVKEEHEEVLDYRCTTITGDMGSNRQSLTGAPSNVR